MKDAMAAIVGVAGSSWARNCEVASECTDEVSAERRSSSSAADGGGLIILSHSEIDGTSSSVAADCFCGRPCPSDPSEGESVSK